MKKRSSSPAMFGALATSLLAACSGNGSDTPSVTTSTENGTTTGEGAEMEMETSDGGATNGSESDDGDGDTSTGTGEPQDLCGDGKVDEGEECDLGPLLSDNSGCTTECVLAECGDGLLYIGEEACDDGNAVETDDCTTLCEAPGCDDGFKSGDESDIDCGGGCLPCDVGLNCELHSDCETWACEAGICGYATSCAAIGAVVPEAPTGRYFIDVDDGGPNTPFEVFCELEQAGGGWTLVLVSSDDAQATWTWVNRLWMGTDTTVVGSLDEMHRDYKSRAYNEMVFRDILAVHHPSGVWAQYDDASGGNTDLGHFVAVVPSPNCNLELAGNGIKMTNGTLVANIDDMGLGLCDTDLYVNLGDHDSNDIMVCLGFVSYAAATFGLGWSRDGNQNCPFDDPSESALGPISQCGSCEPGTDLAESAALGFGGPLLLNTGEPGLAENYMQIFVR